MSRGYYAATVATSLASSVTSSEVDLPVTDGATFPDPEAPSNAQYTVIVGYGSDREEVCTVVAKPTANTLRVTRGEDGTSATAKNIGDVVVHGVSARDFADAAAHRDATTGIHGIADTAALVTKADAAAHRDATTGIHGIADTAALVTKAQMDAADALRVSETGDTMTGALQIMKSGTGQLNLHRPGVAQVQLGVEARGGLYSLRVGNQSDSALAPASVADATSLDHAATMRQLTLLTGGVKWLYGTAVTSDASWISLGDTYSQVLTVVVCNGDSAANGGFVNVNAWTQSQFQIQASSAGAVRVNWIAVVVP